MRLGVVLEAFLDRTLDDTLDFVARGAPQITDLEIGVGGFAPTPHCDVGQLLRDPTARRRWAERLENRGFRVSALNVSGNPLDPDGDVARLHDEDLRNDDGKGVHPLFATVGRGHATEWWRSFTALAERGVESISIEHEDPTMSAERGVKEGARCLSDALDAQAPVQVVERVR